MLIMFFGAIWRDGFDMKQANKRFICCKEEKNRKRDKKASQIEYIQVTFSCAIFIKEKWKCLVVIWFDNGRSIAFIKNHKNQNKHTIRLCNVYLQHQVTKSTKLHMNFSFRPSVLYFLSLSHFARCRRLPMPSLKRTITLYNYIYSKVNVNWT